MKIVYYFYCRKRSLGQGNIFTGVCLSTGGGDSMMSLPVWLPGPVLLLGGSASRRVCLQGGLQPGWGSLPLGGGLGRPPQSET